MSTADKLSSIIKVKNDMKSYLLSKGAITSASTFSSYPAAIKSLKPPEVTLTFEFNNRIYYNLTSGYMIYWRSPVINLFEEDSYFMVGDKDYFDLLDQQVVFDAPDQNTVTAVVKVPKSSTPITWKICAYLRYNKSSPYGYNRMYYDSNNIYFRDPDTGTVTPDEDQTITIQGVSMIGANEINNTFRN